MEPELENVYILSVALILFTVTLKTIAPNNFTPSRKGSPIIGNKFDFDSQYAMPKLNIVSSPHLMPSPTLMSENNPVKNYENQKLTRRVDSKSEVKSDSKAGFLVFFFFVMCFSAIM